MIPNPWVLLGALVAAFGLFIAGHRVGVKNTTLNYENAIKAQKLEAASLLAAKVQENAELATKWTQYARNADDAYTKQIADIRSRANVANGVRFIDPFGRDSCSGTGQAATGNPAPSTAAASGGQLSAELSDFLRAETLRADEVSEYAQSCYRFVNEK